MKIAFKESIDIQLLHPVTDEPLENSKGQPMMVEIYGKHTSAYKNALEKILEKSQRNKKKSNDIKAAQKQGLDLLCACVVGFKNIEIETENGHVDSKDIRGTLESVDWIKDQIDSNIVDLENFTEAPKAS